jgi:hypothetical protein
MLREGPALKFALPPNVILAEGSSNFVVPCLASKSKDRSRRNSISLTSILPSPGVTRIGINKRSER